MLEEELTLSLPSQDSQVTQTQEEEHGEVVNTGDVYLSLEHQDATMHNTHGHTSLAQE